VKFIAVGGGVSANKLLRNKLSKLRLPIRLPKNKYTNDNAAMIAVYAHLSKNN
jgi:N6-L-threonylcarbamoyladenine synthase